MRDIASPEARTVSHARNGSAMPRSRAIRRSICRRRRVNLLKRCCERTRTARRRALCERRRLRHAAAILLRQGGDIAPAPVGMIRPTGHEQSRSCPTIVPARNRRDNPLPHFAAASHSRRFGSLCDPPPPSARGAIFPDDAFARSGSATSSKIVADPVRVGRDNLRFGGGGISLPSLSFSVDLHGTLMRIAFAPSKIARINIHRINIQFGSNIFI